MIETFCEYGWEMDFYTMLKIAKKYEEKINEDEAFDFLGKRLSDIIGIHIEYFTIGDDDDDLCDKDFIFGFFDCEGLDIIDINNLYDENEEDIKKIEKIFGKKASMCSGY